MDSLIVKQGRVIDPASGIDATADVAVEGGKIAPAANARGTVIDAKGRLVVPGLIDIHVHLREPGREDKETIATGCSAAVNGGFTSIVSMANTDPPIDSPHLVHFLLERAKAAGKANLFPAGTVSKGLKGELLAEMGSMAEAGAVAFTDDGLCVMDTNLTRKALQYARMVGKVIISHCEDHALTKGGVMNEGEVSSLLGLRGIPAVAEDIMVARDIALAESVGGRIHITHISTIGAVEHVRQAKRRGVHVTADAAPHHIACDQSALKDYDSRYIMTPPLRPRKDVEAVIEGLRDGTIDAIASDHAPHTQEEKDDDITVAPFGVVGLETTVGVVLTTLRKAGLTLPRIVELMTINPAKVVGIPKGTLAVGADADITLIDPEAEWIVDPSKFQSKSRCTPFEGMKLRGKPVKTIVGGRLFTCSL